MAEAAENIGDSFYEPAANEAPEALITSVGRVPAVRPVAPIDRGILAFPAALLGHLPVPVELELAIPGGRTLAVVLDPGEATVRRADGEDVLDGADWEVVVTATESDRLFAAQLTDVVAMRRQGPLVLDRVMDGARPDEPRGLSVERVLERIGARVLLATVTSSALPRYRGGAAA